MKLTIEKGIKRYPGKHRRISDDEYFTISEILKVMVMGDSFLIPERYRLACNNISVKLNICISIRQQDKSRIRVWRIK